MDKEVNNKDITVLAIESSCDETAAAVVVNGREVKSNIISSQIELHKLYGGVVPEIASRKHIENINGVNVLRIRVPEFRKNFALSRIHNIISYFALYTQNNHSLVIHP